MPDADTKSADHRPNGDWAPGNSYAWKPGQPSPNPAGRPRGANIMAPLIRKLGEKLNEHGEGRLSEEIARAIADKLVEADPAILRMILERLHPVPKEIHVQELPPPVTLEREVGEEPYAPVSDNGHPE